MSHVFVHIVLNLVTSSEFVVPRYNLLPSITGTLVAGPGRLVHFLPRRAWGSHGLRFDFFNIFLVFLGS